jgi:hypothetical protein
MVGTMPDDHREHPSRCSEPELKRLLSERRDLTERRISLKRDIRHLVAELGDVERRLDAIDASEGFLLDDD